MARCRQEWIDLFQYRFQAGTLKGHSLGNLILTGLELRHGDFVQAVQVVSEWLEIKGTVLPITLDRSTLYARLANGQTIRGETNIDIPKHNPRLRIKQVLLRPPVRALPETLRAIQQADTIILTIGDLYSSILPNLLVDGIASALRRSHAQIIYACNRVTKLGETRGFSALDYVREIDRYLGKRRLDQIIVDKTIQSDHRTRHLVRYDRASLQQYGIKVVEANLVASNDRQTIDGKKLAATIARLCGLSS